MLDIQIKTIPHDEQRYPTVGDYWLDPVTGRLEIRVSDMGNWKYEALVAIHELAEYLQITHEGVPIEDIDRFDIEFERGRRSDDFSEPGNNPQAPYFLAHQVATCIEAMMANRLGVDWNDYDKKVNEL